MKNLFSGAKTAAGLLAIMWIVWLSNPLLPFDVRIFGIYPRTPIGLVGIFLAPFVHLNRAHLVSNSIPLFFLLIAAASVSEGKESRIILPIIFLGGLGTWIFGDSAIHIGASGLVFGLFGFLLFSGIFRRNWKAVVVSLGILFLFGGVLLAALVPLPKISWSSHVFGFLAGAYVAKIEARRNIPLRGQA